MDPMDRAETNFVDLFRASVERAGGRSQARDGMVLTAGDVVVPGLVTNAIVTEPVRDMDALIGALEVFFAGAPHTIHVRDGRDDAVAARLESEGYREVLNLPAMILSEPPAASPHPDDHRIDPIASHDDVDALAAIVERCFPAGTGRYLFGDAAAVLDSGLEGIVVRDSNGHAVACGTVALAGGLAGVGWIGTLEHARGMGLGEATTRRVTRRGFDLGASEATLMSAPLAAPLYRRIGYRDVGRLRVLLSAAN